MIGYSKKNSENYPRERELLIKRKRIKPGLKFNPGLAHSNTAP